ncbi:MAG: ABC transporter ATP-binding protein [Acidobacteriota bacterium]
MIRIEALTKSYGSRAAVDGLSFSVAAGEILGLVGPNGAGKTTTLRCLCGVIPAGSGQIEIAGHDLIQAPIRARRALAFIPDEPKLFEHLTVRDHLMFQARLYGVTDAAERGSTLLREFQLEDRLDAFPAELSRGMKQKLMVTLALMHRPSALVLDEPLTGLDPAAMRRMKETILRTAAAGAAVLISSHLLSLVEEICTRVLILKSGCAIACGTLPEIRAALPGLSHDADLEEIFMRATEGTQSP